jgi:hypothetical protein
LLLIWFMVVLADASVWLELRRTRVAVAKALTVSSKQVHAQCVLLLLLSSVLCVPCSV